MKPKVAVVRYDAPLTSVRNLIELSNGFEGLSSSSKVFIKPNIVFWTKAAPFPKYGVITTSQVVHDIVVLLKEYGVNDITLGEGTVVYDPKDYETVDHAFHYLGYRELHSRYGVKCVNTFQEEFRKVDLGDDVALNFSTRYLESDFLVNLPVMKTHAQTVVSFGIKNIKGLIDLNSRKKCHSADDRKDLHYMVAKLGLSAPESFTLIDGIYTNERGPAFDGRMRRSNLLVGSKDLLSADKVAATLLGWDPAQVPHLVHFADFTSRTTDLSDVDIVGENPADLAMKLDHDFAYNEDKSLPLPMQKMGIEGLSYYKYDLTMCTYCSLLTGATLFAVAGAWQGNAWDEVEVLTGKKMQPNPNKKHSILIGKCLFDAHKNHPEKEKLIFIKSCPPKRSDVIQAFHQVGIEINPSILENIELAPAFYSQRYMGKPEFQEEHFQIK